MNLNNNNWRVLVTRCSQVTQFLIAVAVAIGAIGALFVTPAAMAVPTGLALLGWCVRVLRHLEDR
jgi:hypothetical protein